MKNNYELNQVDVSEMNQAIELTDSEMKDLSGGGFFPDGEGCTGGRTNMPFFCEFNPICGL
jgi:hypothetical protein